MDYLVVMVSFSVLVQWKVNFVPKWFMSGKKITKLALCVALAPLFNSPIIATATPALDQKTLTTCTSLKTGLQLISKTGKCNERIYESTTWHQKGLAPTGTPGSTLVELATCTSKNSALQTIRKRATCNANTQVTSSWQRPLGPPTAPEIKSVAMGMLGTATLNIDSPSEDGGARITSYLVTSTPGQIKVTYTPAQIKAARITGLVPGTLYSFTAVAINSKGVSPSSLATVPRLALTTPDAPIITRIVATGTNSAQITFTAPANNGGSPIISYVATSNPGGLRTTLDQAEGGVINLTNLSHSTTYTFTLTANNAAGPSTTFALSTAITTFTPPPPPEPVVSAPSPSASPSPSPGPATRVAITRASAGTERNTSFTTQPQITIQDAGSNTITSSSAVVSATISAGGILLGTDTATATSGVATFTNLGIDGTIGSTYTIMYTANGLTAATATVTLSGTTCDGTFTCQVGDTGPGGGIVFYVTQSPFVQNSATGSMCSTNCKYLEVAPATWQGYVTGAANDDTYVWSTNTTVYTSQDSTTKSTEGNLGLDEELNWKIGQGFYNTSVMKVTGATSAAQAKVLAYGRGLTAGQWFIPSMNELNELCKYARGQITGDPRVACTNGGELKTGTSNTLGGFVANLYWSSTEAQEPYAWGQDFGYCTQFNSNNCLQDTAPKSSTFYVRPIRAFGAPIGQASKALMTTQPSGAVNGAVFITQPVVRITDANGNTITSFTGNVTATLTGSGALSGTTTIAAVSGIATFTNLIITGTSGNFTLTFTPTSLTAVTSNSFNLAVGPATKVAITRASVGTTDNVAFTTQPQITIQDSGGNTVSSSSEVVSVSISPDASQGSQQVPFFLIGNTSITASNGIATFTNLGIDGNSGKTYTLTYSVNGLTVATATVTVTLAQSCASGGTCQIGDTGPGGGIVFYVESSSTFTQIGATGSMCSTNCKYLEAAPANWQGITGDSQKTWATGGNQSIAVSGANRTAIGAGYQNSLDIVNQSGNVAETCAAVAARAYTSTVSGVTYTDWFLPSSNELYSLYYEKGSVTGLRASIYWSSTSSSGSPAIGAIAQLFDTGVDGAYTKSSTYYLRPVRAFGPVMLSGS